jgi:succinate dehydrogenase / fumarate reductase cytochrome b subunit
VLRRERRPSLRGRRLGGWAFVLNRATGLALVAYLYVHLAVLSLLALGPGTYDDFVRLVRHPLFLAFDVGLIAALVAHGLNGVRTALAGSGLAVGRHRGLYVASIAAGGLVVLVAAYFIFA